jgi:inorganic phosphate transporter, PiT family
MLALAVLTLVAACALAGANGANDVSRGVATLVGSGAASYRRALAWGTLWTTVGGLAAFSLSTGLILTFSTRLVKDDFSASAAFPPAVALGACAWVALAARTGLPVSTTHSLVGAIVGTGLMAGGVTGVDWPQLAGIVLVPLAFSPFVSAGVAYGVHASSAHPLARGARHCVCLGERPFLVSMPEPGGAMAARATEAPAIVAGASAQCEAERLPGIPVTDLAHWGTSALLSFARGLNDAPKIAGIAVLAAAGLSVGVPSVVLLVAAAMGAGSYVYGRRGTVTLAERVTGIDPIQGLTSSAVASSLVLLASVFILPVSTTHVASGAIIGAGLRGGADAVRWHVVRGMALAWLVTLPASGILAAIAWMVLGTVS